MAKADSPTKTCGEDGCSRPLRARGLCSTHYNQRHQPERHRGKQATCCVCGKATVKKSSVRYEQTVCSYDCRWYLQNPVLSCPVPDGHAAHHRWTGRLLPALWIPPQARQPARRVFVGGRCARCGSTYLAEDYTDTARYCSIRCARRVAKQRYRARKKDAYVEDVRPALIHERDGWRCQLCRKLVDRTKVVPHPKAPVLDHIIPLAKGGTHEPTNVQCAHFLCNSLKRDRLGDAVQLMMFG